MACAQSTPTCPLTTPQLQPTQPQTMLPTLPPVHYACYPCAAALHVKNGGGVAHLRWSPQCSPAASAAAAAVPCEPLKRRTCTRRCNGRCGRSVACSWRRTCAALSSARATPWQVAGLLCTSKMQGGVGECGCKRWQCGEQPLPGTGQNPVPAWDKILPQFRHRQRAHVLQQHCYTHVRLG